MTRREMIGTMAMGGAVLAGSRAFGGETVTPAACCPRLTGREFQGMAGTHAPLFTPLGADGRTNEVMVEKTVEWCLRNGLVGFYVGGSTGEGILMSVAERKRMLKRTAEANRGRGKLIAHVGAVSTDDAVELARYAADCGYDWVSAIQTVFFGQDFESVRAHYARIAGATSLPFMIYSRGAAIDPERDARLFDIPNVKGMKYTAYAYWDVFRLKQKLGKEAIFFAGADEQLLCGLSLGSLFSGGIGTTYNYIPKTVVEICRLAFAGRYAEAQKHQANVIALVAAAQKYGFGGFKATMRYIGLDQGPCLGPNRTLTEAEYAEYAAALDKLDFIRKAI